MTRAVAILALAATALAQAPPEAQAPPAKPAAAARKPAPTGAALPNYNELKFPELRLIASPAIQEFTLPNGLRLLLLEDHELPLTRRRAQPHGRFILVAGLTRTPHDARGDG